MFISILVIYSIYNNQFFQDYLTVGIDRISAASVDLSANRHFDYYKYLYDLISRTNIIQLLLGYGTSIAGYPYAKFYAFYTNIIGWSPESDVISILIGNGIIGFLIYYGILIKSIKFNINSNKKYILISILFGGIFYVFFRNTMIMIIMVFLYIKKNDEPIIINSQNL
jgi:hypothetical protein